MRTFLRTLACSALTCAVAASRSEAQFTPPRDTVEQIDAIAPEPAATPQRVPSGNILNPNVSVTGWMQATAGDGDAIEDPAAVLKEAELGLQAAVDPYSKADVFISFREGEEPELEETYLTFLGLPARLQARVGKFRDAFLRFNLTHPAETPFADRPLAAAAYLGEEGLASTGAEVSWLAPLSFFAQITGTVQRAPVEATGAFGPGTSRGDLLYGGRASIYADVSDSWNLALDASLLRGPADGTALDGAPFVHNTLTGASAVVRWKNRRYAIYRSLVWHTELYRVPWREVACGDVCDALPPRTLGGGFSFVDYQFARRWHAGVRADLLTLPQEDDTRGVLGFLTFTPSEFSLVSAQLRHVRDAPSRCGTEGFLKITFNIGPHGAHPF